MSEFETTTPMENEVIPSEVEVVETTKTRLTPKPKKNILNILFYSSVLVAIIVLYILHFITPKQEVFVPKEFNGTPGTGEVLYVNLDTINENYELVKILTGDIKAEMKKQETIFGNKEAAFQKKYAQFQENYSQGILSQIQIENAQKQLQQEYQLLESEREMVFSNLQNRQTAALTQIYDSLQVVIKRINVQRNASFILTYQTGSPFLILADPTKEITDQVLFELNKPYKK
jgi:Skp family chaperone for outer membrane proteins